MKNFFKNIKGLSLSEVLVSAAIVMILSVYGFSFFESAWKYRADNDEYQDVLTNVASNMESSKYSMCVDKLFTTEILGSDRSVTYNVVFGAPTYGCYPITSNATVVSANRGSPVTVYKISLVSRVYGNWERAS